MRTIDKAARALAESVSGPWDLMSEEGKAAAVHEARACIGALIIPDIFIGVGDEARTNRTWNDRIHFIINQKE